MRNASDELQKTIDDHQMQGDCLTDGKAQAILSSAVDGDGH